MKRITLHILNKISGHISSSRLFALSGQKLISPVYHLVSDTEVPHIKFLYPVRSIKQFKSDIDYLLRFFIPVSLGDLIDSINGNTPARKNTFFLSFDDGLSECYDTIAPILKEKGVPATFFLNPAFIDNKDLFFKYKISLILNSIHTGNDSKIAIKKIEEIFHKNKIPFNGLDKSLLSIRYLNRHLLDTMALELNIDFNAYLKERKPYLNTEQIKSLLHEGHTIGAHSLDHPHYMDISVNEQIRQTKESIDFICKYFSLDYKAFAFPFTDFGVKKNFFQKVFDRDDPIADITFGAAGIKKDISARHLHRLPMEGSFLHAKSLLNTELLYYMLKMPLNKNRIRRK